MVTKESLAQLKGLKQLLDDAFGATLDATERLHQTLAGKPYHLLAKIELIATPVKSVEQVQAGITHGVYAAIRSVHQVGGGVVDKALELAERRREERGQ